MFIQTINKESKTKFIAVRFGNVLGSQPNRDNIRELVFNRERLGTNEEELNITINLLSKLMEAENRVKSNDDWLTEDQVKEKLVGAH